MNENQTVDTELQESVQADAAQAPVEESAEAIALTELLDGAEEAEEAQDPVQEEQPAEEQKPVSGGIKGRLLDSERKGHEKGYQEGYSAAKAELDAQIATMSARLAKLDEIELHEAAVKLAKEEGCSENLAMRILRAERGLPAQQTEQKPGPARDENGRFVKAAEKPDAQISEKAQQLADQAKLVHRLTGVDVAAIFREDKDVQQRIISGEIDFADLAEERKVAAPKKSAPPVVRYSSGAGVKARGFNDLSDDAFDNVQRQLALGKTIDLRR